MERPHEPPSQCPVCRGEITVTSVVCEDCGSELRGRFALPPLARLPRDLQRVVELLVRCRGNLKELERRLGISYPTVSKKLDATNMMLDVTTEPDGEGETILQKVQDGELTVDEAVRQLRDSKQRDEKDEK